MDFSKEKFEIVGSFTRTGTIDQENYEICCEKSQ